MHTGLSDGRFPHSSLKLVVCHCDTGGVSLGLMTCWFTLREVRNDGRVAEGLSEPGRDRLQGREGAGECGRRARDGSV